MNPTFPAERFIPIYERVLSHCRSIDDSIVVFDLRGRIVNLRTENKLLSKDADFFAFSEGSERSFLLDNYNNFSVYCVAIRTTLGTAAVFTELVGFCGLFVAVISHGSPYEFAEHLRRLNSPHFLLSEQVKSFTKRSYSDDGLSDSAVLFDIALSALSVPSTATECYRASCSISSILCDKLLAIADLVGVVGVCRSDVSAIPYINSVGVEALTVIFLFTAIFARESTVDRRFEASMTESDGKLPIIISLSVDKDIELFKDDESEEEENLTYQSLIALQRTLYLSISQIADHSKLTLAFLPDNDQVDSKSVKQRLDKLISKLLKRL